MQLPVASLQLPPSFPAPALRASWPLQDALADIGPVGNQYAMSKEELVAMQKHKQAYAAVISTQRTAKKNAHLTRRVR